MRFVLVAEEAAGARALRLLADSEHTIIAVLTEGKAKQGLGAPVKELAESRRIQVLSPKLVKDPATAQFVEREGVDILLNVYSLYQVHEAVVSAPRVGSFNLHPGKLPEVAGRNPVSAALYEGHDVHGVTVHHMVAEFDAGLIAFQAIIPITDSDSAFSLSVKSVRAGEQLVAQLLRAAAIGADAIPRVPQDFSKRKYYPPAMPEDGWLEWDRSAVRVANFIRAYDFLPFPSPWGHPKTMARDAEPIGIAKARRTTEPCTKTHPGTVGVVDGDAVDVATGDEWIRVEQVSLDGKLRPAATILQPGMTLARPPSKTP